MNFSLISLVSWATEKMSSNIGSIGCEFILFGKVLDILNKQGV